MTYAVSMLRRGRTYDIEDGRATTRLHTAYAVLKALGAEPTITHGTRTYFDWSMAGSLNPDKHLCALNGSGNGDCTIVWPEWVTDGMLNAAYALGDTFLTGRGAYNRAQAR